MVVLWSYFSEAVLENMTQTAVYVPGGLKFQQPVFFAADNIDCDEDRPTPDGKSTLHDTLLYLYFSLIVIPMQVRSQICHLISNTQHQNFNRSLQSLPPLLQILFRFHPRDSF